MKCQVYSLDNFRKTGDTDKSLLNQVLSDGAFYSNPPKYGKTWKQTVSSIEARYGMKQPKGGCVYLSPVHGMKLDSYGRGNVHNSVFQYMPRSKRDWNNPMPFPSDLRKVFGAIFKNKGRVMVLGYKSDPLMWMDQKYKFTQKIIKFATRNGVQLVINTMSDLAAHDDYIALLKAGNHSVTMNMSMNDGNEEMERQLSPGAPSLRRRQKAVEKLQIEGVEVSIQTHKMPETKEVERRTGLGTPWKAGVR